MWKYKHSGYVEKNYNMLSEYLANILKKGEDFVVLCVGIKGAGKSMSTASLAEGVGKSLNQPFTSADMTFTLDAFLNRAQEKIDKEEMGVVIGDDFGSEMDPYVFQEAMQRVTSHYLQKSRTNGLGYILTVPNPMFISKNPRDRLSNYWMEVIGHNKVDKVSRVKFQYVQVNLKTGQPYYHNFRLNGRGLGLYKVGMEVNIHEIPLPSKEVVDWYVPLRKQLGQSQLKTSINKVGLSDELVGIAQEIASNIEGYLKTYNKDKVALDKPAIVTEYGISQHKAKQIEFWLKRNNFLTL